jgi:hypothetical protein
MAATQGLLAFRQEFEIVVQAGRHDSKGITTEA